MGKRDHDSTMDLSLSQLVVPKPPKAPPPGVAQNDVSVWGQLVVGTADFAPAPKKRATHAPLWIGLGVVGTLAIAGAVYVMFLHKADEPEAAAAVAPVVKEPSTPAPPAPTKAAAASTTKPETKAEAPAKPSEPVDPQKALAAAEPVLASIRAMVAAMRSAFQGAASLDPKKTIVAKKPALKKKPVRRVVRRRR